LLFNKRTNLHKLIDPKFHQRKIIHVDMDAFYASVEQRDNPALRGKPVAVGGSEVRGVVSAASYEARKFGVYSAMPGKLAKAKCPSLVFVKLRFEAYRKVSQQIRSIFEEYTDLVEPLSLDEAYLDVTENKLGIETATEIAKQIKEKIFQKTHLTASAGISYNKFLAKIASDFNKPNGLFVIKPNRAEAFVDELPVAKFHGVGKVTAEKMHKMGINVGADLKKLEESELVKYFGKAGHYYYQIARAIDMRQVSNDGTRKSLGAENTFDTDLHTLAEMQNGLEPIIKEVWNRIERANVYGRTITLKIKFDNFETITRSKSAVQAIKQFDSYEKIVNELIENCLPFEQGVRLLGVTISNFETIEMTEGMQLTLNF
jgi:DNA polymerase IV